jgi:methionine synthase I (cobalamin-dependent)
MNGLIEALHSGRVLLMDGAMGTELQRLGMAEGQCSANWNLTHPEQVASVHCAYLEAGADILLTNTFLANQATLERFGLQERYREIWNAAFENLRIFRDPAPMVLVDVGPSENSIFFANYLATLFTVLNPSYGILLETWSCTPKCQLNPSISLHAASGWLPVFLSFSYRHSADKKLETIDDAAPEDCALAAAANPVYAIGANCGDEIDMGDLLDIVRRYREITELPIFIRPNAGTPRRTASGWEYPRSPEYMADKLWPLLEAGVTMVGGCCGTTPAHIAAFRRVVDEWNGRLAKK